MKRSQRKHRKENLTGDNVIVQSEKIAVLIGTDHGKNRNSYMCQLIANGKWGKEYFPTINLKDALDQFIKVNSESGGFANVWVQAGMLATDETLYLLSRYTEMANVKIDCH